MNIVILHGRVATDIEIRKTTTGKDVATFNIAVNKPYKKDAEQKADFFPCVAWDKLAEIISKHFGKGREILLEGRLQTRSYEAQDGSKRYVTEIIVGEVEFCGSKGNSKIGGQAVDADDIPF